MNENTDISTVKSKVIKVINSKVCFKITEDYNNKSLAKEFGLDSLEIIDIITMLEKLYHIPITDEDFEHLKTINNIVNFIEDSLMKRKYLIKKTTYN